MEKVLAKDLKAGMIIRGFDGRESLTIWTDFKISNARASGIIDGRTAEIGPYVPVEVIGVGWRA